MTEYLPTINAIFNTTATILLLCGWVAIKFRHNRKLHQKLMIAAFIASAAFLATYLLYHFYVGVGTPFKGEGVTRYLYYFILITHIPLAGLMLPFIFMALWYAYRENFAAHIRIVKWLWPTWMYVSVTGVLIYLMLYVF